MKAEERAALHGANPRSARITTVEVDRGICVCASGGPLVLGRRRRVSAARNERELRGWGAYEVRRNERSITDRKERLAAG